MPESRREPELVPALWATGTADVFLFLSAHEPNKPGRPGGQDRTAQSKSLAQEVHAGLAKIPYPSCQMGPERARLTLVGAWGQLSEQGAWALQTPRAGTAEHSLPPEATPSSTGRTVLC